ncbi:MAG: HD-GYP domain-containing protein [Nitrospiria bacterium]
MPNSELPIQGGPKSIGNNTKLSIGDEANPISSEESFLRALSRLISDRDLYPQKHPQIIEDTSALEIQLLPLFEKKTERTFVFIEDQIYIDDRLLNNSSNMHDILKIFQERRIDGLILRKGLSWQEFVFFLNSFLLLKDENSPKSVFCSPHIETKELLSGEEARGKNRNSSSSLIQNWSSSAEQVKGALKKDRFHDEAKMVQDIYMDWNTAQKALGSLVVKIMNVLEKGLYQNQQSFIPLAELKEFDEYTYVHAINLAILTMAQAESMNFPKEIVHAFGIGALLHDVGKTQVPLHILNKQGQLTPEEFDEIKKHPMRGAFILLQYPEIPRLATIIAYEHHLKYDGTGYPVITQKRLPHISSRIAAISDQFDALRSNRSYREALPPEKILEIMYESRGTGLDPILFDRFMNLLKSRKVV